MLMQHFLPAHKNVMAGWRKRAHAVAGMTHCAPAWGGRGDWQQQLTMFFASQLAPAAMSAATHSWRPNAAAAMSAVLLFCAPGSGQEGGA